jgi:hypothetical protein
MDGRDAAMRESQLSRYHPATTGEVVIVTFSAFFCSADYE